MKIFESQVNRIPQNRHMHILLAPKTYLGYIQLRQGRKTISSGVFLQFESIFTAIIGNAKANIYIKRSLTSTAGVHL